MSLSQQAPGQTGQSSPKSAVSDSSSATPNSPRTPSTPTWSTPNFSLHPSSTKGSEQPPFAGAGEGRCSGPRDQECVGDQVSMSQQGPASRHASRRSSKSPAGDNQVSPPTFRHSQSGIHHQIQAEQVVVPHTNGDSKVQQIPHVHNILNPPDSQRIEQSVNAPPMSSSRPPEPGIPTSTSGSTPAPLVPARPYFPGQATSMSLPGTPVGSSTPLVGTTSERNSPTASFPFPAMNPRRILSPKVPRAASLSVGGGPARDLDTRSVSSLPGVAPAKRPYDLEGGPDPRAPLPGLQHIPQSHQAVMPQVPRSVSHAGTLSPGPHMPANLPPSNPPVLPPAQQLHGQPAFQQGMPPNPNFQGLNPMSEGSQTLAEMLRRRAMSGGMAAEPQQAYMTLPGSDTPIPVQVDYSQASKKADEKRQRNAVASTRHRRKKKILQEENTKQLQELRDERRAMEIEIGRITRQRDFYKEERNRLRDIVSQTPGIQMHAAGPPSPSSTRSSFAERSPMIQGPPIGTPSQSYASEASSAERPAQRRRMDDHPEFTMPIYGAPPGIPPVGYPAAAPGYGPMVTPAPLPPMQGQAYGVPSRPTSTGSTGSVERLPPLRAMGGPPPGPGLGPGHGQEQDPRTGQWVPVQARQQETGWATMPQRPPEGPPR